MQHDPDSIDLIVVETVKHGFIAAEPLLLEAYQGFAKRRATGSTPYDDQQIHAALTNIVQLYDKSKQPEKAKAWKDKMVALTSETGNDNETIESLEKVIE